VTITTTFAVYIQPRASKTEVAGWHGDAIKIRLQSPPVDGAANDELMRFISKLLGVSRSAVSIVSGATGRRKRLSLEGITQARVLAAMGLESE
jgi:uncharacterized protein (TIGR00251 family)